MRLSWAQLESLLDKLTDEHLAGKLELGDYVDEWNDLIDFAGWTWEEFAEEIDRRWTRQKKEASPLFMC
jgi:hypothetical protein